MFQNQKFSLFLKPKVFLVIFFNPTYISQEFDSWVYENDGDS